MTVQTEPMIQEFPCPEPATADIKVGAGAVTVTAWNEPMVAVHVTAYDGSEASRSAAESTRVHFAGGRLSVETDPHQGGGWLMGRRGRVRVEVHLPSGSTLRANVGSADIKTVGAIADMVAHTGSGDVSIVEASGDVNVESGSGDVRAEIVGGELRVQTASGDVIAQKVAGRIVVETASGDIRIDNAVSDVRVRTASGDVRIGSVSTGEIAANSVSGDVYVGVVSGTRVWLDVSSVSGSTRNELDMTGQAPTEGAAANLRLRTVSGDITIGRTYA